MDLRGFDSGSDMELESDEDAWPQLREREGLPMISTLDAGAGAGALDAVLDDLQEPEASTPSARGGKAAKKTVSRPGRAKSIATGVQAAATVAQKKARVKEKSKAKEASVVKDRTKRVTKKNSQLAVPGEPRWSVVRWLKSDLAFGAQKSEAKRACSPHSKPRIWAASKEELMAILPELSGSKCVNGISWLLSSTPIVMLDGDNWRDVSNARDPGGTVLELTITRDFECAQSDLSSSTPSTEESTEIKESEVANNAPRLIAHRNHPLKSRVVTPPQPQPRSLSRTTWFIKREEPPIQSVTQTSWVFDFTTHSTPESIPLRSDSQHASSSRDAGSGNFGSSPGDRPFDSYSGCDLGVLAGPDIGASMETILSGTEEWDISEPTSGIQDMPAPATSPSATVGSHTRTPSLCEKATLPLTEGFSVAELPSAEPVRSQPPDVDSGADVDPPLDQRIPLKIPPEIQVLIDAYVQCVPIVAIASYPTLLQRWKLSLSEEYGYVYLGFFKILRLWEERVMPPYDADYIGVDHATGRVQWRFRLQWAPGGEDFIGSEAQVSTLHPWWMPSPQAPEKSPMSHDEGEGDDSDTESTLRYRRARKASPNYARRHTHFSQIYYSMLPLPILAQLGPGAPDGAFPRGWYCTDCGKLNYQAMLRHRRCTSTFCQDKPLTVGYAVELNSLRDPQQALLMTLPYNVCPRRVECAITTWQDGMKTLSYTFDKDNMVLVEHIFACNANRLQQEASTLLRDFQIEVPLRRQPGSTSPYFSYEAGISRGKANSKVVDWVDVPVCVAQAKDVILRRSQWYGEADHVINRLFVLAWVSAGTRKATDTLHARDHSVLVMCLGNEVVLTVTPKSALQSTGEHGDTMFNLATMISMDDGGPGTQVPPDPEADVDGPQETLDAHTLVVDTLLVPTTAVVPQRTVAAKRETQDLLTVTLVHGDIMVLSGDDFEYALKRSGTSLLIFASYVEGG